MKHIILYITPIPKMRQKTLGTDSNDADSFLQSTQSGSNITEQLDEAYSTLYSLIDDEVNNVLLLH